MASQWIQNGGGHVIVCNCVIRYQIHEDNQLPLQLLQQKYLDSNCSKLQLLRKLYLIAASYNYQLPLPQH